MRDNPSMVGQVFRQQLTRAATPPAQIEAVLPQPVFRHVDHQMRDALLGGGATGEGLRTRVHQRGALDGSPGNGVKVETAPADRGLDAPLQKKNAGQSAIDAGLDVERHLFNQRPAVDLNPRSQTQLQKVTRHERGGLGNIVAHRQGHAIAC
ncbi:MAG: hypothetical protein DI498_00655 [Paracoccus denitrificans]|nr:MAG: hypothetical protein DI498_00655 [Paracoccus denitrificans]PZO86277.1 MAG: hypothetical protein DI633_00655 [Paracoccus denitrificans]